MSDQPTQSLSYFPALLDDELLYSIIARYHRASGNANATQTKKRFFGTVSMPTVLPGNLEHFAAQLPPGLFTVEDLIERHSIFPYFAPFLSTECGTRTLSRMREEDGLSVKVGLGLVGSRIKDVRYLRLCIHCVSAQRASGQQPYWRRVHQIPGVEICPVHEMPLIDHCAQCGPFDHRRPAFQLPDATCPVCRIALSPPDAPLAGSKLAASVSRFARLSSDLLAANLPALPPRVRSSAYGDALAGRGIKAKKSALSGVIAAHVYEYWGNDFLKRLGLETSPQFIMPRNMFHDTEATVHPVLHLLLIGFLFGSVELFAARLGSGMTTGVPAPRNPSGTTTLDLLALLKANGFDIGAAAALSGVSAWTLAKDALKQGIAVGRFFGQKDPRRNSLIASGLKEGAPIPEIAAVAAVSVETVYRRLKASPKVEKTRSNALQREQLRERRKLFAQWVRAPIRTRERNREFSYRTLYHWLYYNDRDWLKKEVTRANGPTKSGKLG